MLLVGAESKQRPEAFVLSAEKHSKCMDDGALAMSQCRNVEMQSATANASIEMEPAELLTPREKLIQARPRGLTGIC